MENIIYPENLYKHRVMYGIARYRHIEGNIYEDTTCKDHVNCMISVKLVDDHYELEMLINESAIKYRAYHSTYGGDTYWYDSEVKCIIAAMVKKIESTKIHINRLQDELREVNNQLLSVTKVEIDPVSIEDFDFGDSIYWIDDDIIMFDQIKLKVIGVDGLHELITCKGYTITNDDNKLVVTGFSDDDYNYGTLNYPAFKSDTTANQWINNQLYDKLVNRTNSYERVLIKEKIKLKDLQDDLDKYQSRL